MSALRRCIDFAILVVGFSGIVSQIVLLRELLVTFYGNELFIGIFFANWLILEALGCFLLGRLIDRARRPYQSFVALQILFCTGFPLAICLTRLLKGLIGFPVYEALGLTTVLYSTLLIFLPVSFPHGAIFAITCRLYSSTTLSTTDALDEKRGAANGRIIGRVYVLETLGTIVGGVVFTYLLIPHLHSFQMAFGVTLLCLLSCLPLHRYFLRKDRSFSIKVLCALSTILFLSVGYLTFTGVPDKLNRFSIKRQWKGQDVVHYENSRYGNITVTKRGEQYTFFFDGIPILATPTPDIVSIEEFVHIPMLLHPKPQDILLISRGVGGVIDEVLRHSPRRIDYLELDPLLLKAVKKFPTSLSIKELSDKRVNVQYVDGRLFLKRTSRMYDLVFVGFSNPSDLQVNRFFTKEFFTLVKRRLKGEGILVMSLPGSLTYLGRELRNLNSCILNTLRVIFPYVRVIPGDGTNLFLASSSQEVYLTGSWKFSQRLNTRGLKLRLINPSYLQYRLHPRWKDWFMDSIKGSTDRTNKDFSPLGLFYSLSYLNTILSPYLQVIFQWAERVSLWHSLCLLSGFAIVFLLLSAKIPRFSKACIPLCIGTSGFAGMLFDLGIVFAFQVLYGYVFYWIGLLVAAFMTGVMVGSLWMTRSLSQIKEDVRLFLKIEVAVTFLALAFPLIFLSLDLWLVFQKAPLLLHSVFLFLSVLSGCLIGLEFPLANKIYLKDSTGLGCTAGLLYSSDLLGGWIGGILGGVVLLPVLGFVGTFTILVALKVSVMLMLAISNKRFGPMWVLK